jgi:copper chaperone
LTLADGSVQGRFSFNVTLHLDGRWRFRSLEGQARFISFTDGDDFSLDRLLTFQRQEAAHSIHCRQKGTDMHFKIEKMACGGCVKTVTAAVTAIDPAARVEANMAARTVKVETTASAPAIARVLADAGYPAQPL